MATLVYHSGIGALGSLADLFDESDFNLNGMGNTATLTDSAGVQITMQGTGFSYSPGSPTWSVASGVASLFQMVDGASQPLFEYTGGSASAADIWTWIMAGKDLLGSAQDGPGPLWQGDNFVFGSILADEIISGLGDDTIQGAGGRDIIINAGGEDLVTGGARRDFFVPQGGTMMVTDFNDSVNPLGNDKIAVSHQAWRRMVVEQDGADTRLTFDDRDAGTVDPVLVLLSYDSTQLDRSDFIFGL